MTIRQLLAQATKKLSKSTSPELDAEVLLSHALDKPKEYLLTNLDKQINPKSEKQFHIFLNRRLIGWPVAYLTNKKEFQGLNFYVDKNVLIPRPETEELVNYVVKYVHNQPLKILDIGVGSGAIIVSLASALSPQTSNLFFASDISAKALSVAKRNAKTHKVNITFKQGSLLAPWKNEHFDIIVANLPYLSKLTDPSIKFEPKTALLAKNKGLALFEELFKQIDHRHSEHSEESIHKSDPSASPQDDKCPRFIFLEIGHDQSQSIKKLAAKWLPAYKIKIYRDLSGHSRFAVLQLTTYNL